MIEINTRWIDDLTFPMEDFLPLIATGTALLIWAIGTLYMGRKS